MALGIYKPKEGYWMRVMTACMVATITLASAGWLWGQGALIADKVPRAGYFVELTLTKGTPAAGMTVEILGQPETADAPPPLIGTTTIEEWRDANRIVRVKLPVMQDKHEIGEATAMRTSDGVLAAAVAPRSVRAIASIEPLYVQGGLAFVVILAGAVVALWLAGIRRGTVDFLIATDSEMKRVNWSTPREIRGSTFVVIGACFFLSAALFVFDFIFQFVFKSIGVLAG
ncbi:MAG: preprotein translocase subunit SecE [Phycisphaerales bacterium]